MDLGRITRCVIHPGIGVARIGNSPDEFFIGPEAPSLLPTTADGLFKDAQGRIRRQAARFRIYGFDSDGKVVKELTSEDAEIVWTVHLANKKAAWYGCDLAMDIPQATVGMLRNPDFPGNRKSLVIDSGQRSVSGANDKAHFDSGMFLGINVPLGEIRTDATGNLLVLGGLGKAGSVLNPKVTLNLQDTNFDGGGWFDDISDGPVTAQVTIGETAIPVTPAWVIVGPPDYAPGIKSPVTLYDIAYEVAINAGWLPPPDKISFTQHIYPIFHRMSQLQWVNEGFYLDYGKGASSDFVDKENLTLLSDNSTDSSSKAWKFRQLIFGKFRNPEYRVTQPDQLPPMYGDGFAWPPKPNAPNNWLTLPKLHYGWLKRWAEGDFVSDWDSGAPPSPKPLKDLPLEARPQALDQSALENCLGGAFHPGCEVSWPMRWALLYSGPFRIKVRPDSNPEKDYGKQLTPKEALDANGPLNGSTPGDLTRWMYVPWQVDTAVCGSGFQPNINPFFPTFWPARVPNQVLTEDDYKYALSDGMSETQRLKYFGLRLDWLRDIPPPLSFDQRLQQFIDDWSKFGIIVRRENQGYDPVPPVVHVETQNELEDQTNERNITVNSRRDR